MQNDQEFEDLEYTEKDLILSEEATPEAKSKALARANQVARASGQPELMADYQEDLEQQGIYDALNDSVIKDSKGLSDELNNQIDEIDGISEDSEGTPYGYQMPQSDTYETTRYERYRNTGVAYFDKKKDLSLLDAYLAKKLGLDVKWNYHKIDMKGDFSIKNRNQGAAIENMMNSVKQAQNLYSMVVPLMVNKDTKENIQSAIKKGAFKAVGGMVDFDVTDPNMRKTALTEIIAGVMTSAGGRSGRITDEVRRNAAEYVKGAFDNKNYYDVARVMGDLALNAIESNYQRALMSGFDDNTLALMHRDVVNARKVVDSIKNSNREDFAKNPVKTFAVLDTFLRGNRIPTDRIR